MYLLILVLPLPICQNCLIIYDSIILVNAYAYGIFHTITENTKAYLITPYELVVLSATQYALYFGNSNTVEQ
jgi:hypothetical protein